MKLCCTGVLAVYKGVGEVKVGITSAAVVTEAASNGVVGPAEGMELVSSLASSTSSKVFGSVNSTSCRIKQNC